MKKILSVLLICALLSAFIYPVQAATQEQSSQKEEIIYAVLDNDGKVSEVYVVNSFKTENIVDYGDYIKIKNLSTTDKITVEDDLITVSTDQDSFYYQGYLESRELPWTIQITYLLDNEAITADDLAGKSGKIDILINIEPNTAADSFFFSNYTLSVSLKLDERLCNNIEAPKAVIATAGMYKQLTYTILPDKKADLLISFNAVDFEMEAMNISAIKMTMDMDIDTSKLTEQFTELSDAIKQLDDGAVELLAGFTAFCEGLTQYVEARNSFHDGITQLSQGVTTLKNGTASLAYGLDALAQQSAPLVGAIQSIQAETFNTVNEQLKEMQSGLPVLTPENYTAILENIPTLAAIKQKLDDITALTSGFTQYTRSIAQLSGAAAQINTGALQLNGSLTQIQQYSDMLNQTAKTLELAATDLKNGLDEYAKGVDTLNTGTKDLSTEIQKGIDDMVRDIFGNSDETRSYVSDKNTDVTSVQFVFKTEAITDDKAEGTPDVPEEDLNFWQRLLKLFGLYD